MPERIDELGPGRVKVGFPDILSFLDARIETAAGEVVLLFGSHHDAAGQLHAFRRLVGPLGLSSLTHVAVEQLEADGHWTATLPDDQQRGDDSAPLASWRQRDEDGLRQLLVRQRGRNYTAWRYGYLDEITDLLIATRATASQLVGCDMPMPAQRRVKALEPEVVDRLRELHCSLALERAATLERRPLRAAVFWGDAHLSPEGFGRFVSPEARLVTIHMVGHRANPLLPDALLGRRLSLTAPALVPLDDDDELVLLLPGRYLSADVERSRDPTDRPWTPTGPSEILLRVESVEAGTLTAGEQSIEVQPDEVARLELPLDEPWVSVPVRKLAGRGGARARGMPGGGYGRGAGRPAGPTDLSPRRQSKQTLKR